MLSLLVGWFRYLFSLTLAVAHELVPHVLIEGTLWLHYYLETGARKTLARPVDSIHV